MPPQRRVETSHMKVGVILSAPPWNVDPPLGSDLEKQSVRARALRKPSIVSPTVSSRDSDGHGPDNVY
jgi:hypothetical protein